MCIIWGFSIILIIWGLICKIIMFSFFLAGYLFQPLFCKHVNLGRSFLHSLVNVYFSQIINFCPTYPEIPKTKGYSKNIWSVLHVLLFYMSERNLVWWFQTVLHCLYLLKKKYFKSSNLYTQILISNKIVLNLFLICILYGLNVTLIHSQQFHILDFIFTIKFFIPRRLLILHFKWFLYSKLDKFI